MTRLRAQGIERLVMLTGDNTSVARRVAEEIGITEVRAELLPAQKLTVVRELEQDRGVIAMIGDGVNDAPALAAATVGVAMGAGGTAVALETAVVVLMGDDLGKLSFAIGLSRASARIIRQNLVIALGVIALLVVASGFGVIPLSVALRDNPTNFRVSSPDETNSNRWGAVLEVTNRCSTAKILPGDDHVASNGRVMEILSEHQREGWLEGYLLTGRHGFFSCYEAFIHIVDSMVNLHAKWLDVAGHIPWRRPIASLNPPVL